jgi:hypothetical protein
MSYIKEYNFELDESERVKSEKLTKKCLAINRGEIYV